MCLHHVFSEIFRALDTLSPSRAENPPARFTLSLSLNAQRAHPNRDQRSGRLKLGLHHVYGTP
jgi:hypothetical protein